MLSNTYIRKITEGYEYGITKDHWQIVGSTPHFIEYRHAGCHHEKIGVVATFDAANEQLKANGMR